MFQKRLVRVLDFYLIHYNYHNEFNNFNRIFNTKKR